MNAYELEKLVAKVGGPFRLTVLFQKRLKELKSLGPKFVDPKASNMLIPVYKEILEDKISLIPEETSEDEMEKLSSLLTDQEI